MASPLRVTYILTDLPTHPQIYTLCKCLRQSEIITNRQNSYSRKHKHIMKLQCYTYVTIHCGKHQCYPKSKHVLLMLKLLSIHIYTHSVVLGGRNRTWKTWGNCQTLLLAWFPGVSGMRLDYLLPEMHTYIIDWFPDVSHNRLEGDVPVCMKLPITDLLVATYTVLCKEPCVARRL